jgi:hypothetical protein
MGRARLLRIAVASALLWTAMAHAECVSALRETSSGVFNRLATGVAWTGTALGVAKVNASGSREITFAIYSEDLTQLTADRLIVPATFSGATAVLWTGSDFGIFYTDSTGQLFLQRVSIAGEPAGSPVAVAPNHPASPQREYDVTWDRSRQAYVVGHSVLTGDKGLWITILNRDGSVRSESIVTSLINPPLQPHVAVNGAGSIAIVFKRNGVYSVRVIDANGTGSVIEPLMTARDAAIAGGENEFIFAGNTPISIATEIHWAVIDSQGRIVSPVSKMLSRGAEVAPVSLMWNGDRGEWALAYLSSLFSFSQVTGDYRLRRFTTSGDVISDGLFGPDTLHARLTTSLPFAWTGSSYISATSRAAGSVQPDSYVTRNCPLTARIAGAPPSVRAGTAITFTAAVDGGAGGSTYEWNFGDGRKSTAAVTTVRFDKLGEYPIVLRVTDSVGATSVTTMTLRIVTPRRPAVKH